MNAEYVNLILVNSYATPNIKSDLILLAYRKIKPERNNRPLSSVLTIV